MLSFFGIDPDDPLPPAARALGAGAGARPKRPGTADALVSSVLLCVPATSLGGVESTLERRRRHPSEPDVVPESLVRLSVGVEDVEDLRAEIAMGRESWPKGIGVAKITIIEDRVLDWLKDNQDRQDQVTDDQDDPEEEDGEEAED